ncbi:MAG: hypothetical protein ACJAV1_001928 [Paraglaciecola sp.]|jgi:hypothetical protein
MASSSEITTPLEGLENVEHYWTREITDPNRENDKYPVKDVTAPTAPLVIRCYHSSQSPLSLLNSQTDHKSTR